MMTDLVDAERRAAARLALERVIADYQDVLGPMEESVGSEERPTLGAWVIVTHWQDLGTPTGWTTAEHSGCAYPMQIGLLWEVIHGWEHARDDDDG